MTSVPHCIDAAVPNGTRITTLCGSRLTADMPGAAHAQTAGDWMICLLCELRRTLIGMGLESDPYLARRQWGQPTLF